MPFNGSEIFYDFDPWELTGKKRPKSGVRQAKKEIADLIKEEILNRTAGGNSPVQGGDWKRSLSKEYKKRKQAQGGASFSDMRLEGDMLSKLEVISKGENLRLRIKGSKEAAKADGHNNHSGGSSLPRRDFIPDEGETFKRPILTRMKEILGQFDDD